MYLRLSVVVAVLMILCVQNSSAVEPGPQAAWLAEHGVPLTSIQPAAGDFADLEFLKETLGNTRVVMLGEATHGDGAAFLAKTRLIKFLHEELGFNVLAWEAGVWHCDNMYDILCETGDTRRAAQAGLFPLWADSEQTRDLFAYCLGTQATDSPLCLAGFDPNATGDAGMGEWIDALISYVDSTAPGKLSATSRDVLAAARQQPTGQPSPEQLQALLDASDELVGLMDAYAPVAGEDDAARTQAVRWARQLQDLAEMALAMLSRMSASPQEDPQTAQWEAFKAMANRREQGMIDNLTWLATERFAGEKIIVWAASAHCLRGFSEMQYPEGREDLTGKVALGQGLYDELGTDVYALAISGGGGSSGAVASEPWELPTPAAGSLEAFCLDTGSEYLYLDIRGNQETFREVFGTEVVAAPLGYAPMVGDWTNCLDGLLFIKEMTPSNSAGE